MHSIHRQTQAWMPEFQSDLVHLAGRDRGYMRKPGVDAAVDWMEARLRGLGCETQVYPSADTGGTVTGRLAGQGAGRYLLIAHLDTVWPAGTAAGWPVRLIGQQRVTGPGVVDNTSGSLTGYYVMRALKRAASDRFAEVTLLCNGDEESGSLFSGALIQDAARGCDAAFCLEAPSSPDEFVSRRAGSMVYELTIHGRRAHSQTEPEKGVNAILELAHKIIEAHEIAGDTPVLKVCAVTAEGGPQSGIIPDTARAQFDVRLDTLAEIDYVEQRMQTIASRSVVPGTTAEMRGQVYHPPMDYLPGTAGLAELAREIGRELGIDLREMFSGGVADGSFATAVGTPALCGLAPFGAEYHTFGEWLDLSTVPQRAALVAGLVAGHQHEPT